MAWYVFALVDGVPSGRLGKGLSGVLSLREVAGAYAAVERRADVPPVEFGALRLHQGVVMRLALHVPAILPVRFGTLLDSSELEEALAERDQEIAEAFAAVRDRVQFTWRISGRQVDARRKTQDARRKAEDEGRPNEPRGAQTAMSGAEYLRHAARAAHPRPPAAFRGLRARVAPLVVAERYQPGATTLPDTLYHLVEESVIVRYRAAAEAVKKATPRLAMTGPWPPFAFAPEVLR